MLNNVKSINLYYNEMVEDTNKILELLSKNKKYAVYSMTNPENTILFVKILNDYLRIDGYLKDFDKTLKANDIKENLDINI